MDKMKTSPTSSLKKFVCRLLAVLAGGFLVMSVNAADFIVRTPGFAFTINNVNSPALTLVRGRTYTFDVNTACGFHPFRVNSPGVDTNNMCFGLLTYVVPTNNANYFYDCTIHGQALRGEIVTVEPPPLPVVRIVGFDFTSNIVLRSTGTNTFSIFPEYKTNLNMTNWFALTVQTNRFLNGTNETICGRPAGNNLFIRLREVGP
jgi:hypothetical protein